MAQSLQDSIDLGACRSGCSPRCSSTGAGTLPSPSTKSQRTPSALRESRPCCRRSSSWPIYLVVSIAAQSFHGAAFLTNNSSDVLNALGRDVLGSPWDKLLIIAILTSASASTQTTILPAGRSALSMAVHKALPPRFGSISPRFLSPGFATLLFGAISVIWYVGLTILSPGVVLANSILALGFGISFYYGITGFACVIYYRRLLFKSLKNFVFIGLGAPARRTDARRHVRDLGLLLLGPGQLSRRQARRGSSSSTSASTSSGCTST